MTVRRSRLLVTVSLSGVIIALTLFGADWAGTRLPQWTDDLRWLLFVGGLIALEWVAISRRLATTAESFRIGVRIGSGQHIDHGAPDPYDPTMHQ